CLKIHPSIYRNYQSLQIFCPILTSLSLNLMAVKHNMAIVGAAMRKLLHIIFGILTSKSAFNPNHIKNYRARRLTEGLVL
ncbi:MAG: hypothetical protein ACEY3K_03295, partial [Wolbachia sp.]